MKIDHITSPVLPPRGTLSLAETVTGIKLSQLF